MKKEFQVVDLYRLKIGDIITLTDGSKARVITRPWSKAINAERLDTGEAVYLHAWGISSLYLKAANVPNPHTDENVEMPAYQSRTRINGLSSIRNSRLNEATLSKAAERHEDLLYLYE